MYESRRGKEDPRIQDTRVLEALKQTKSLRQKIDAASPPKAYKLSRKIWPTLQKLHEESEQAAMSQQMFQKMGQEGRLGDKNQNAAAGSGQLKLGDLNWQQREQAQKEIEKLLKEMTPEQREELRRQIQEQMRRQEQEFRKTMGKSESAQPPSGSPTPGGQSGQDDPLARLGKSQDSGGEINPSGTQGTSDSVGDAEEKIEKIKSGGLDAGQRSWLDQYMEPVRGMVDTLAYKIRKHLKATALGRDLTGLYEGDVDEDALPYYKAKIGIMKEELLPGRPKARITFLIDLSGSMGQINGGGSLDHAARALLMALKAFRLAFKNEPGVEVRVVAYNENPQLSIIGNYMQVKDISDAVLYKVIERINEIQNTCRGDNCDILMMMKAVQDIRDDMKGHADTTYALLHIGDGDRGADLAAEVRATYDDPANAKIRFANLAAGPQARDMYDKYQPYSFWARELSELGMKWAEIVEATFKKAWQGSR